MTCKLTKFKKWSQSYSITVDIIIFIYVSQSQHDNTFYLSPAQNSYCL